MLRSRLLAPTICAALVLAGAAACGGTSTSGSGSSGSGSSKTLVVDDAFDLKTTDPARSFEFTGVLVDKQIYETTLNYDGPDVKKIVPGICSYKMSADNKVLTLTIAGSHMFSDGSPVTADDIVFSYQRLQQIQGNPAFLLDGVKVAKKDDKTVTLTSATANPQLPFILPNPSLGIVNSAKVKANGGTATKSDNAEAYLNKESGGSGPYMLESYNAQSKIVLKANPSYGGTKPAYDRVVLENVDASTQKVNIQAGTAQMAVSLGPDQLKDLDPAKTKIERSESTNTIFMWFNQDKQYGKGVANPKFVQAMRHAIDYQALLSLAGSGSKQPGGMVPTSFLGALASDPNNSHDEAKAKALLQESGYSGEAVSILYSNDVAIGGVKMQNVAESIQAQVKPLGVELKLNPQPSATSLDSFRSGKAQAGVAYWGADYPDPADYLTFAPGQGLAKRAAWTAEAAPTSAKLAEAAASASGNAARAAAYEKLQKQMNIEGPFIPLFLPPKNVAYAANLKGVFLNPIWNLDFGVVS
jgi:peptide/nickel transport system substrate-binding protein